MARNKAMIEKKYRELKNWGQYMLLTRMLPTLNERGYLKEIHKKLGLQQDVYL